VARPYRREILDLDHARGPSGLTQMIDPQAAATAPGGFVNGDPARSLRQCGSSTRRQDKASAACEHGSAADLI